MDLNINIIKNQWLKVCLQYFCTLLIPIMVVARLGQAWIAAIYDWDTAELLIDADLEDRPPGNFANIAHPYALVVVSVMLRLFKGLGVSPRLLWFLFIALIFLITVAGLYVVVRQMSQSKGWALALTSFYVVSPSTHEILARQEENLLYHLPFVLTIYFLSRLEQHPEDKRSKNLGLLSLFGVAICHFQPSASLMIGLGLWVMVHFFNSRDTQQWALMKPFIFAGALPLLLLGFLFAFGLMAYVPYHKNWYSIFTVVDVSNYIEVYFNSFQHFMFTKAGGFGRLQIYDYYVFSSFWIGVGVFLFGIALAISMKARRLPSYVFWGALIFIAMYEPNVEERWDVILLSLICMLASVPSEGRVKQAAVGLIVFMFVMFPNHAFDAYAEGSNAKRNLEFVAGQMKDNTVIYGSHEGLRRVVMEVPYGVSYRHLDKMKDVPSGKVMVQHQEERDIIEALGKKIGPASSGCYRANHCRIYDFTTP